MHLACSLLFTTLRRRTSVNSLAHRHVLKKLPGQKIFRHGNARGLTACEIPGLTRAREFFPRSRECITALERPCAQSIVELTSLYVRRKETSRFGSKKRSTGGEDRTRWRCEARLCAVHDVRDGRGRPRAHAAAETGMESEDKRGAKKNTRWGGPQPQLANGLVRGQSLLLAVSRRPGRIRPWQGGPYKSFWYMGTGRRRDACRAAVVRGCARPEGQRNRWAA